MYLICFCWIAEKPAKFTQPLEETKAKEGDNVTLTCKLDKQNVFCTWLKNGKELQPGDGVQISSDGYTQQLILTDVTIKDAAKYTCVCGDVSTEATFLVEGMYSLMLSGINPLLYRCCCKPMVI